MAELIDKGALLEQYGLKDATKYGNKDAEQQAHSYSTLMLYEIADMIDDIPTVTEAEIRAKAIAVMGIAMKEVYPTHKANYVEFDVYFRDVMLRVAEQLKGE